MPAIDASNVRDYNFPSLSRQGICTPTAKYVTAERIKNRRWKEGGTVYEKRE